MSNLPVQKQIIIDGLIFVVVFVPLLVLHTLGKPVPTGFWCRDQSLSYPYRPDTVPQSLLLVVSFGGPFFVMAVCESIRAAVKTSTRPARKLRTELMSVAKAYSVFLFGIAANCIFTETLKLSVGRLRPHFFDLCRPNFDQINCTADVGQDRVAILRNAKPSTYASDDYTNTLLDTRVMCADVSEFDALIIVHTAHSHFEHRQKYRETYGSEHFTWPYKLKLVFFLGLPKDPGLQPDILQENTQNGDTVQGNFTDTYRNLTYKAVMAYRWVSQNCRDVKALLKMDDDVILDVHRFFEEFPFPPAYQQEMIYCHMWKLGEVERTGKWGISLQDYKFETYPPYCSGFIVVVTPAIVEDLYLTARSTPFLWLDDVFIYGVVREEMKQVQIVNLDEVAFREEHYKACYRQYGYRYVLEYECTNTEVDQKLLRDSHLSFPSGHASVSVFSALFTIFYLQMRMKVSFSHLLRPALQMCILIMAVLCCITRVTDYKHFTSDVLVGVFIGASLAWLSFYKLGQRLIPSIPTEKPPRLRHATSVESEPQTPTPLLRPERLIINHVYRNGSTPATKEDFVHKV